MMHDVFVALVFIAVLIVVYGWVAGLWKRGG
jgi:hypothetical protein